MLIVDILIGYLLGLYLDQVMPSMLGLRKHPLFCLMCKKKAVHVPTRFSSVFKSDDPQH
jgi:ABC-type multidrug transport system ATPase subunit